MQIQSENKTKGFTLVELLVVIAIIALLLSILMPALAKVREQGRRTVCGSHFKQIGIAQNLYATEWRSWLPRFRVIGELKLPNHEGTYGPWPNVVLKDVFEYVTKSYQIPEKFWFCPSLHVNYKKDYDDNWAGGKMLYSIGGGKWPPAYWDLGVTYLVMVSKEESAARITDPGYKVLGADVTFLANQNWRDPWSRIAHKGKSYETEPAAGANRLHVDGSVKWVNSSQMAYNNEPLKPKRWWFGNWPKGKNTFKWSNEREWYW